MEHISKEQWDQLNDAQKNEFQEELGKKFYNGFYPNGDDILTFLTNKGYNDIGIKELKIHDTPSADAKDIDELWENVINYFVSKEK